MGESHHPALLPRPETGGRKSTVHSSPPSQVTERRASSGSARGSRRTGMDHSGDAMADMDHTPELQALSPRMFEARMAEGDAVVVNVHVPAGGTIEGTDETIAFDEIADSRRLPVEKGTPILLRVRANVRYRRSRPAAGRLHERGAPCRRTRGLEASGSPVDRQSTAGSVVAGRIVRPRGDHQPAATPRGGGLPRRRWWRRPSVILLAVLAIAAAASVARPGVSSSPTSSTRGASCAVARASGPQEGALGRMGRHPTTTGCRSDASLAAW